MISPNVQSTALSSTFDFWRNRTNELADIATKCAVTTDNPLSNTGQSSVPAVGNAAITGTFTANVFLTGNTTVNSYINSTSVYITNSTVNTIFSLPTASQYGNNFLLAANGSWVYVSTTNNQITYSGNNIKTVDSYSISQFNGAEYLISVKDNNANNFYTTKILTTHDTGSAYLTEYASFTTNTFVGTFTAGVSSGTVVLYFTPSSTNTTVKFVRTIV